MSAGGITYGVAKPLLATVVENGIDPTDTRVLNRTNEAIKEILDSIIPVNGMMTADVAATGTTILLPPEMENAIFVEIMNGATVNNQSDTTFGWFTVVNNFTYIDPSEAHDLPLVDQFLQPDPTDQTTLRRQYDFPGLTPNAVVRVTGAKRWIPIDDDNDFLIVQNIPAIKEMIQAIEYAENNDRQNADAFRQSCLTRLQSEVKKHLLDPTNSIKRKAAYEADLVNFPNATFGYTRARLAFELPGGLSLGKSELTRLLEQAERGLMDKVLAVGMVKEYTSQVSEENSILCPKEVESILAVSVCGYPLYIKSIFTKYMKHGHRWWSSGCCCDELRDEGEVRDIDGDLRRQYKLQISGTNNTDIRTMKFLAALRWIKKAPADYMTIGNFEAIRLKCSSILKQKAEKYQESIADEQMAIDQLDKEIRRYLGGQLVIAPTNFGIWSSRRYRGYGGRFL